MGYLREATKQDINLLFDWVNERSVRENSFLSENITYQEHKKWFENLLKRDDIRQYIYVCGNEPVGQIRVTIEGEEAEIGYSVCLQKRGLGYGKEMVRLVRKQIKQDFPNVRKLVAKVKPGNVVSQKVFLDMGYVEKYYLYELEIDKIDNMQGLSEKQGRGHNISDKNA